MKPLTALDLTARTTNMLAAVGYTTLEQLQSDSLLVIERRLFGRFTWDIRRAMREIKDILIPEYHVEESEMAHTEFFSLLERMR